MEREGMIKEAIVAKATPMINTSINHNSYHEVINNIIKISIFVLLNRKIFKYI